MPNLQTNRLSITPFTLDLIRSLVADRATFAHQLMAQLPDDWPDPHLSRLFHAIAQANSHNLATEDWGGHLIIRREGRVIIGYAGFKGPPDAAGTIEVGYGIGDSYQRQGFATEAVAALIDWAFTQPAVRRVVAECLPDNAASIRVLEKLGMRQLAPAAEMLDWARERPLP